MSCNTKTSLAAVIDAVNAQLNNNYVDRDDPRINQGVFTEPTIRGGLMLDEAAKLDFCGYVTECGQREPFGKQWVDRPLYPDNTLVSYEDGGEIKSRWQDTDDVVAGTEIGESYTAYEETRNLGLQGYTIIDSFELGATITQRNEALRHTADGKLYRWAGDLPKVVPADSTPVNSGGIGDNAWLEVSDVTLRQDLANPTMGAVMVGRGVVAVDSIADLLALPEGQRKEDLRYLVKGYYAGSGVGGGEFYWDGAKDKAQHNGGIVIDPDKLADWSGYQSDIDNLFVPLNTGTGCWVRLLDGTLHSDMFGLVDDDYATDQFETIRNMIRGILSLANGRGTAREFDIFIRGGWRAEVKSGELQFPNARYWSDKKAIRLPFTETFAATNPGYAIQLWGGEYHNFDFDGYRKDYGVGTSPTVPSVGQGALCALSGAKSYLYNCDLHGAVYPGMVTFGPEYAPTLVDCHIYDSGEHHCYFSGTCNQARFIRCKFGRLSMQGTRTCLVLKFRTDINDPEVDVEFHDITLDTAGGGGTGQTSLFTALELSNADGWRLKNFVMDGIDFGEDSTISRIGNLGLSENCVITNFHMRNIKNCPALFQTSSDSSPSASIFGNTLKNVEFLGSTGGLIFFDEIENIRLGATLVTLDTLSRSLAAAFKPGQKTHIKNMRMEGEFGVNNLRLESSVNKTVEFTDLVIIDTRSDSVAPIYVTNSNLSIPSDSANPQKYIFNNIHIETSNPNSIFMVSGNASGGEIQLEFNGGSINKFIRSSITPWTFTARNGFFADYYQTSSGVITLVSGNNKPQRYSADETCRGLSVLRKVTIPVGDTSVSFNVSTSSDRLKVNEMEYVIRATPMTQYEGQVEGFVITGGSSYGVRISSAHTDDLDVLLEIRLHKYE